MSIWVAKDGHSVTLHTKTLHEFIVLCTCNIFLKIYKYIGTNFRDLNVWNWQMQKKVQRGIIKEKKKKEEENQEKITLQICIIAQTYGHNTYGY